LPNGWWQRVGRFWDNMGGIIKMSIYLGLFYIGYTWLFKRPTSHGGNFGSTGGGGGGMKVM